MTDELFDLFERFQQAVVVHDQLCEVDPGNARAPMVSADAVVRARLEFYGCLIRLGWSPSDVIKNQMQADAQLTREDDDRRVLDLSPPEESTLPSARSRRAT